MHKRNIVLRVALLFATIFTAGCIDLKDFMDFGLNDLDVLQKNLTSSMHGKITDSNNAPLENVSIMLEGSSSRYSDSTDANGRYNFSGLPADAYRMVVFKAGYKNLTLAEFNVLGGYSYTRNVTLASSASVFYGAIRNFRNITLEGAVISIISNEQNYSGITGKTGEYTITGIQPGTYDFLVEKTGYKNVVRSNLTFLGGTYSRNVTTSRDCSYYSVNTSVNYVLRYGYTGTTYRGDITFSMAYPAGAAYDISPTDSGLSEINIGYQAGNRMLKWTLDNSDGYYSSVEGHIYINMNGTETMQLYNRKEMSISEAASMQSNYLGSQTNKDGETLIDPYNSEIRQIAQQVKSETGSEDTWTVARALFIWLKNNTVYYIDPQVSNYTHLPAETLNNGRGKCDELSHLYISMLRANGIPARFVQGYLVYGNTKRYISHRWVEFYDGEWVPVEVSGGSTNASAEADYNFAVLDADHVKIFVDDGTSASMVGIGTYTSSYYDWPSAVSPFDEYYDAISYDPMYLAVCADGTRELVEERE